MTSEYLRQLTFSLSETDYRTRLEEKYETTDYLNWQEFTSSIGFLNDTTKKNASYVSLLGLSKVYENLIIKDYFILQKSIFDDVFFMYVKSKIEVKLNGKSIDYPYTLIISDIAYYEDLFNSIWKLVLKNFPEAKYIMYRLLIRNAETAFTFEKNNYELLFGYEGNIVDRQIIGRKSYMPRST